MFSTTITITITVSMFIQCCNDVFGMSKLEVGLLRIKAEMQMLQWLGGVYDVKYTMLRSMLSRAMIGINKTNCGTVLSELGHV